jgi:methyl-accepting chemotaxis protein/methyl-accepting chemotaxis protein-1 (serine sensor receptor)
MDQATQQNAALVEQMAAAASSLKSQAGELVETVAVFRLSENETIIKTTIRSRSPKGASPKGSERRGIENMKTKPKATTSRPLAPKAAQLPKPATSVKASAGGDDNWETF